MKFRSGQSALPGFQITPMLDVVFLLLCFFVATSVYSQWENEISIQLPTAVSGETPERLPGEIVVNVAADGSIRVNGRDLTPDQLGARLRAVSAAFPGQPIVLRADKAARYEHVMLVMDECRKSDVWNISFATQGDGAATAPVSPSSSPASAPAGGDEPPPAAVISGQTL